MSSLNSADQRFRLHIKNNREGEEVFRITEERLNSARHRHGDIADKIEAWLDWDLDHFEQKIRDADALVTWDLPTENLAARAPKLRWIHVIGAGVEHLKPLTWIPEGVSLINSKGVHAAKAEEYATMALLSLNARLPALMTHQRAHRFKSLFTGRIAGKTLLVVGAGHMGEAVAHAAQKLGLKVIGIRRSGVAREGFDEMYGPEALDQLLGLADFVALTTPLTPETEGLIDARRLSLFKDGSGLINMSRGQVLDQDALSAALQCGKLSGAILDVTEPEPLPGDSPLWDQANLLITPHVSSDDLEEYTDLVLDVVFDNIRRDLAGEALKNIVDPDLGY
jgi:phosphoglycerate dehydrogenase-like enzyme